MDKPVKGRKVKGMVSQSKEGSVLDTDQAQMAETVMGLISSMSKMLNVDKSPDKKGRRTRPMNPCLALGCEEQTSFPLCPLHYHPLLSGKLGSVKLKNGYGDATYDSSSQTVTYPTKVPEDCLSAKQIATRKTVAAKVVTMAVSTKQ